MENSLHIPEKKKQLRRKIRAIRRALDKEEASRGSAIVCEKIMATPEFKTAKSVAAYLAFDNEVDLTLLIGESFGKHRLFCPRIIDKQLMEYREITSWDDLEEGRFGILEPKPTLPLASPKDIDLILVPAIAFDRKGNRLGLGAGYYDRYLSQTAAFKLGVGYDFQIVNSIPVEAHDHPLDGVISG